MSVLRSALARRFISSVNAGVFRRGGDGIESPLQFPGNAAWYDVSDLSSMRNDAGAVPATGEGIKLLSDKSGNSGVNVLCLNGVAGNYASAATATAFGTADFTVSAKLRVNSLAATGTILHGGANSFSLTVLLTTGTLQTGLPTVGNNTASTGALVALTEYVVTYVRSGTTGTYYINGVSAGTTTDSRNYSVASRFMGMAADGTSAGLVGNIEWVHAYSVALDSAGIAADMTGAIQANSTFDVAFSSAAKLAPSFTATTGGLVTIATSGATGARISGARDLYQGTAANQPILTIAASGNYLTFDGSNDYLKAAAFSLSQPETVYFVGSQISWTLNDTLYDGNSTNERMAMAQAATTPNLRPFAGTTDAAMENTGLATGVNAVVTVVFNGASSRDRINRGTALTGSIGANPGNGFTMGAAFTPGNYANITASEVLLRSVADSTAVQDTIILFEGRKWGITV